MLLIDYSIAPDTDIFTDILLTPISIQNPVSSLQFPVSDTVPSIGIGLCKIHQPNIGIRSANNPRGYISVNIGIGRILISNIGIGKIIPLQH